MRWVCALVTCPKLPGAVLVAGTVALGLFTLAWLNTLRPSARNSSLKRSPRLKLRERAISTCTRPGPVRKSRGVFPSTGDPLTGLTLTNAPVLNHMAAERLDGVGLTPATNPARPFLVPLG